MEFIDYMFDIPEPYCNKRQIMLCNTFSRFKEIRSLFYTEDLSELEGFSVIINVHAGQGLGTYIVDNSWIENPFLNSDDFNVCFSIKEYNQLKKTKNEPKPIDYHEEVERFKDELLIIKSKYFNYEAVKKNIDDFPDLKTRWHIITYKEKPIALVSEHDSWRIPSQMKLSDSEIFLYSKFRVDSLKEGLDYLKI